MECIGQGAKCRKSKKRNAENPTKIAKKLPRIRSVLDLSLIDSRPLFNDTIRTQIRPNSKLDQTHGASLLGPAPLFAAATVHLRVREPRTHIYLKIVGP